MDQHTSDVFQPMSNGEDKPRRALIEWLNSTLSNSSLPANASDDELRAFLVDGSILCHLLNILRPGSIAEFSDSGHSLKIGTDNVKKFLAAMDELRLPSFQVEDIEKGSMKIVIECLLTLRSRFIANGGRYEFLDASSGSSYIIKSNFHRALCSPVKSEPSAALLHHVGHKFQEVFQMKHGCYADLPPAKISDMIKSIRFDNAPTQSLLSVVNGILNEGVERKNGEIPFRVACLLRKVVQEIERRIATQAEHLKTQNQLFKVREEKYQSRIRVLEALAAQTGAETQTQKIVTEEKTKTEEQDAPRLMNQEGDNNDELVSLRKELETTKKDYEQLRLQMEITATANQEIESLKGELEIAKKNYDQLCLQMTTTVTGDQLIESLKGELEIAKRNYDELRLQMDTTATGNQEVESLKGELEIAKGELEIAKRNYDELRLQMDTTATGNQEVESLKGELEIAKGELEIAKKNYDELRSQIDTAANGSDDIAPLKQELETTRKDYEQRLLQTETEAKGVQQDLEEKLKEVEQQLTDSRNKVTELETSTESLTQQWNKKGHIYQICTEFQIGVLKELKVSSLAIKQEVTKTQNSYVEDFGRLGTHIKELQKAAENYHSVLAENRKMHNELQDLKGNIRVYCRIRPFLPGQTAKQTIVEYVGDNGELIVVNPSKQGKDSRRSFKFNQVYGSKATQVDVYSELQPLIQSVLDGYNVCIFAYGQTGSGKTYTMSGPDGASEEDLGVNYRALNDLFNISQKRGSAYTYEIGVQMVEIYNEQVRDLLSTGSQKKLGILSTSQSSGLAVPDASMHPVQSTSDVMDLMEIGLKNRARGSTSMNQRSSRSHSVLTIHARGTDVKNGSLLRGNLHLVDLAGSERIDRSEVTGDRLKEAQHINKSLSALGDVIFALAQKSSHIPYRNSKLTQVLQSSLGGQAKTIMFVQLNPEIPSYTESLSTLKFAERVSGVELGAAKSSKEGKDVKELMEQVVSLKDTIGKKDEEIERLQMLKNGEKRAV